MEVAKAEKKLMVPFRSLLFTYKSKHESISTEQVDCIDEAIFLSQGLVWWYQVLYSPMST